MVFTSASRTHVGHRRKLNEDAMLDCGKRNMWAVADGMGGHHAGEIASALVVEALSSIAPASTLENHVGKAIGALEEANRALVELAHSEYQGRTIGSTIVGLVANDTQYNCFWAGDSRAYRVRDGEIMQLTRDHSLVQDLVDAGMLEPNEAENHPNANVVTRAVGAADTLVVDTVGGHLQAGDVFLLASDGLTRLASAQELLAIILANPLESAADHFIDLALERGAPDNVSLIIVSAS